MKRTTFLWILLGIGVWAQGVPNEAQEFWSREVRGRELRVLNDSVEWIRGSLMLCPASRVVPEPVAALGTVLMYESVGRRSRSERVSFWNVAFHRQESSQERAALLLGEEPSEEQKERVGALHEKYRDTGHFGSRASVVKGSRMASLTLAVYRNVFAGEREFGKALAALRRRLGWLVDLEEQEAPVGAAGLRRGLRKGIPFIYEDGRGQWYLGIALRSRPGGTEQALLGEVSSFAPGMFSRWDISGGDRFLETQPPGSSMWREIGYRKGYMMPFDTEVTPERALPAGFRLVDLPLAEGRVFWVHGLRPDEETCLTELGRVLGIPSQSGGNVAPTRETESASLWRQHILGQERARVGALWEVVPKLSLVSSRDADGERAAALACIALSGCPHPQGLARPGLDQTEFLWAVRDARWQCLPEQDRVLLRRYYGEGADKDDPIQQRRLWLVGKSDLAYLHGHAFWGLSWDEARRLAAYREALVADYAAVLAGADSAADPSECLLRILAGIPDWMTGLERIAKYHGWTPVVESDAAPSFAALRRAVELGVPCLLDDGAGSCRVLAGFLTTGGSERLLVFAPSQGRAWCVAGGTTASEHLRRLLLPASAPGRVAYLDRAAQEGRFVPPLLDPRLPLPDGVVFEDFVPGRYRATFLHSWRRTVVPHAKAAAGLLEDRPPEASPCVSLRMRVPRPYPALVGDSIPVLEIRNDKLALFAVDRIPLDPGSPSDNSGVARVKEVFAATSTVELELLPGRYWVWAKSLPVATLDVAPEDNGKTIDAQWLQLPSPCDVAIRLPVGAVLGNRTLCLTPYVGAAERQSLGFVARARATQAGGGQEGTGSDRDLAVRLFPGVFYVYDVGGFLRDGGLPIGKVAVPAEPVAAPLPIVPITQSEAYLAGRDPSCPIPLSLDRKAMGAPEFLW